MISAAATTTIHCHARGRLVRGEFVRVPRDLWVLPVTDVRPRSPGVIVVFFFEDERGTLVLRTYQPGRRD